MAKQGLAGVLGEFLAGTRLADIPAEVLEEARVRLLDGLGCAIAGATSPTTKRALKWAERFSAEGPSSFWFTGRRGPAQDSAFVNSILAHSILHEDASGSGHPGSHVVPAALVLGEARRSSGAEVLAAVAMAYELQARIAARGAAVAAARAGAFRASAMTGIFGSAAAAARLMKLTPEQMKDTIAFCASLCSPGIGEPLNVGSSERCIQSGQLTRSGVLAAELAESGFDGADTALEGSSGYYRGYLGVDAPAAAITKDLGTAWFSMPTEGAYIYKPYPTAALNVGAVYCAEQIAKRDRLALEDIDKVLVRQSYWESNTGYIFTGPYRTVDQALMSAPFAVATALIFGRYDWPCVERAIGDSRVDALAAKITMHGEVGAGRRRYETAAIDVTVRGGRQASFAVHALPPELVDLTWERVVKKFNAMTGENLTPATKSAIVQHVRNIADAPDVSALVRCLSRIERQQAA